ncbi:hypothetical protein GGR54DRAFT_637616 [Hypoxylon sp. NC1633]|nr:hypothetical protein GGR54DRAFT_637616 [Hypoxylon sp. NC1633]
MSPAESGSPKSPRHKFSDSHSSLSSYASSSASLSHSRISSMSTVGGVQTINTIPDTPSLETQFECIELSMPKIWSSDKHQTSTREGIVSPSVTNGGPLVTELGRSSSPSDALLMSRGVQGLDRTNRQEMEVSITKYIRPDLGRLVPPDFSKHKRAISAPGFTADVFDRAFPPLPGTLQPIPLQSHQADHRSGYAMATASPPAAIPGQSSQDHDGIFCMYKPNCDTGSQLRKAISHIFGRNKTCTRKIPPHVWVHFCRKHYQRSRYRNAQEWARVQCDLVQRQLRRVQEWSDENKRTGQSKVVQNWSLSMRKREQNRVQEQSSKKRSYQDESEEDDDDVPDSATMNGTAVPDWLRSKCGDGYSTAEIEEIMTRLKQEIVETNMTQIPDIEILPNIPADSSDDARPKAPPEAEDQHRKSRPQAISVYDTVHLSPLEKRVRVSDTSPYHDRHGHMGARLSGRPALAPLRPMYAIPHRPAFNNIQESRAEDSYYDGDDPRGANYGYDHWPASASHQNGGQSASSESCAARDYLDGRRPSHQRSFSEVDSYQHNFTFRSPLGYPSMPPSHLPEMASFDRGAMPSSHSHTTSVHSGYYEDRPAPAQRSLTSYQASWPSPGADHTPPYPTFRHARHQSTPSSAHASAPQVPTFAYEHAGGARSMAPYERSPPYHRRQRSSYAPSRPYHTRSLVQESGQAKAVFSERR